MKSIAGGSSEFREIRDEEAYYVDKTGLISEILDDKKKAYLFTRPRRFGKSMNLSMLDAFFNLKYPKDNRWFDGLEISEREDLQVHKNSYPVIYLDFKVNVTTYEEMLTMVSNAIGHVIEDHPNILRSDVVGQKTKNIPNAVLDGTPDEIILIDSIKSLTKAFELYYGKKTIILIDEYDAVPTNTYGTNDFRRIMDFIKGLIHTSTKGNEHLYFA